MLRYCLLLLIICTLQLHARETIPVLPRPFMYQQGFGEVAEVYDPEACRKLIHYFDALFPGQRTHMYRMLQHHQWEYLFEGSRRLARQHGNRTLYHQLSFRLAIIYHRQTKYREAIPLLEELLSLSIWTPEQQHQLLRRIEQSYRWGGDFAKAVDIRKKRLEKGHVKGVWEMYEAIGAYADAVQDFKASEPIPWNKPFALALYHGQLANLFALNDQTDSALHRYRLMYDLLTGLLGKSQFPGMDDYAFHARHFFQQQAWGNIGWVLALQGKHHQAIPMLRKAIVAGQRYYDVDSRIVKYNVLAGCLIATGQMEAARRCIDSAGVLLNGKLMLQEELNRLKNLAAWYKATANQQQYVNTYDQYLVLRDSLLSANQRNQNLFTLATLEMERNRREVVQKQHELDLNNFRSKVRSRLQVALIIFLVLLTIIIALMYVLKQRRRAYEQKAAIDAERLRISGELHDDVSASLSAIYLAATSIKAEQEPEAVGPQISSVAEGIKEVSTQLREFIWSVHSEHDPLEAAIGYVVHQVQNLVRAKDLRLQVVAPDTAQMTHMRMEGNVRRLMYLCVKEATNNVLKHSLATHIVLTFSLSGKLLLVSVKDNGVGMEPDATATCGFGLHNIERNTALAGGTFSRRNDNGLELLMSFQLCC